MAWMELLKSVGLPTIGSTGLLAAIGFLFRNWFIARITGSIKHEYDKDLENYKNQLRKETDSELTKLQGNVAVEGEKIRLKLSSYSKNQFKVYNELWLTLVDLKTAMYKLWTSVNEENFWAFQTKLLNANDVIEKNSIFIESKHYDDFQKLLQEFDNYQLGKKALVDLRQQDTESSITNYQIVQWSNYNMKTKDNLLAYLKQMRDCMRNQISGNVDGKEK